jgi:hypothetical protein
MQRKARNGLALIFCAMALVGCASSSKKPSNPNVFAEHIDLQRNEGYSLLYKLLSDESGVGKIFILKHADDSVGNLVREIGNFCQTSKKQLDDFSKSDGSLKFDAPNLPKIEQESRDLTAQKDEHELLTSSGKDFELRLIFTQAQAMDYAAEVAQALTGHEDQPARQAFLKDIARRSADYHARLMDLLTFKR